MKKEEIYREKVANVALIDTEGKILMELRKWNAYWSLFWGRIDKWEKPKSAAIREVFEETWFKVKNILLLGKNTLEYTWQHGKTQKTRFLYAAPLTVPKKELKFKGCEWWEFFLPYEVPSLTLKKPLSSEMEMIQQFLEEVRNFDPQQVIENQRQKFLALMQNHLQ